jgi:hypothetical protein
MTTNIAHLGLAIESPVISSDAENFRPKTWPPSNDFPITLGSDGQVISRYGDYIWKLSPWAKRARILNFGDGPPALRTPRSSPENSTLLRQVAAWWLYGPSAVRSAITLAQRFYNIRILFSLCSSRNIVASELYRYPAIVDDFIYMLSPSQGGKMLTLLHSLYEQREQLGFTLLDRTGLARLEAALPNHEKRQTAYIPPRIWTYQVARLRLFLDDFHLHREKIESCFHFCLDAYAKNTGSLAETCRVGRNKTWGPFWVHPEYDGSRSGRTYYGPFLQTARRFGIDELLLRWVAPTNTTSASISIRSLSTYFSMVGYVGIAYILNFSLMRIDEGWSLRADCLEIENDPRFGEMCTLRGRTSKTINDEDARWPTSPEVKLAIDAMNCVTRLRMICAEANPDVPTMIEDMRNPSLVVRPYEPWGVCNSDDLCRSLSVRPTPLSYSQVRTSYPNLFEQDKLQLAQADLQVARLVNPSLNIKKFAIDKPWPLAWHQLRRTGAVNMQASGLVSDASLQYLLKHASRAMSLYYGQGYSRLNLNEEARALYVRTMYEVLSKEIARLFSDRFVSPHGQKRKAEILGLVNVADSKKLNTLARSGMVSYRETLLGGCTKRGPCPYGGIDNIVHCAGADDGNACSDVLYDRERMPDIHQLGLIIQSQIAEAMEGTPYRESLEAQQRAVVRALNVIHS